MWSVCIGAHCVISSDFDQRVWTTRRNIVKGPHKMIGVILQIISWLLHVGFHITVLCVSLWLLWKLVPKGKVGEYHKRYVLITGCDSGFGKETAIRLDQMGFHVFATCLTMEGEEGLKAVCSERVRTLHLDVTSSETIQEAYNKVKGMIPAETGLWGLVNNAGVMMVGVGPIEWLPLNNYKRCADVNLWGLIEVTKTFLPLVKQAKGRVTNFASMFGRGSIGTFSAYCISKYGVEAFSDALRREMSPFGIRVSILEPGSFKTGLTTPDLHVRQMNGLWSQLDEDLKSDYGEEYLQKGIKIYEWHVRNIASPHTYKVVDAVVDSLTSCSPSTRYAVGLEAKRFIFFSSWLPAAMADWLTKKNIEKTYRNAMSEE